MNSRLDTAHPDAPAHDDAAWQDSAWQGDATSVLEFLRPLRDQLDAPGVLEVCINRPGELLVETVQGWHLTPAPAMTLERCLSLATAVATWCDQQINQERPLLSATLPSGERIQFVIPPAVMAGGMATPAVGPVLRRRVHGFFRQAGFRCSPAEVHQTVSILARWRFQDTAPAARAVRCPVFAAWTDDDAAVEPAVVEELLALLPDGPRLHFETGGHNLQKSQATEIAAALVPWVHGLVSP